MQWQNQILDSCLNIAKQTETFINFAKMITIFYFSFDTFIKYCKLSI